MSSPTHLGEWLDVGERIIVLAVYLLLVARILAHGWFSGELTSLLLLPSEGLVVVFLLLRRRTSVISLHWQDWLLALSATLAPMLVAPSDGAAWLSPTVAAGLMLMGIVIQVHAKITLGRSFGCVAAHRGLKLGGPYCFIRHPMYAGYLLSHVAFLLVNPTWRNAAAYAVCYALQVPRLMSEERLLSNDPNYQKYQAQVRFRLIPGLF